MSFLNIIIVPRFCNNLGKNFSDGGSNDSYVEALTASDSSYNELEEILRTLSLELYIPAFSEQVFVYMSFEILIVGIIAL